MVSIQQVWCTRVAGAVSWLTLFFDCMGEKMPNGSIHMPIILNWKHLHSFYASEIGEQPYSYQVFHFLITHHFPKVCMIDSYILVLY